jgi:surface antigen
MKFDRAAWVLVVLSALTGCATGHGAAMGRSGDAAAIPIPTSGVILGGVLASDAGKSLEPADIATMNDQTVHALETAPTGQSITWQNAVGGTQGRATPTRMFQQANGNYCRDYNQSLIVKGQPISAKGTACRDSDGTWHIVG